MNLMPQAVTPVVLPYFPHTNETKSLQSSGVVFVRAPTDSNFLQPSNRSLAHHDSSLPRIGGDRMPLPGALFGRATYQVTSAQ
jgi:hypothetical protein